MKKSPRISNADISVPREVGTHFFQQKEMTKEEWIKELKALNNHTKIKRDKIIHDEAVKNFLLMIAMYVVGFIMGLTSKLLC